MLGIIAIAVILLFTLFALRNVKVNFRTSLSQDFPSQEEIVEAGEFSYGSPVLFLNKKKFKENIEQKYPYVEVINIETVFPATLAVHVRERQEVYAFIHNGKVYYCDNNLVVLREEEGGQYVSEQSNSILISGLNLPQQEIRPGDKLSSETYIDFYDALLACNRTLSDQETIIHSIEFSIYEDVNNSSRAPMMKLHTFAGNEYYIYNADKYISYKAERFLSAYSSIYTLLGQTITLDTTSEYYGQVWTEELLARAYVVINNYYQVSGKENPAYANIYPPEAENL